MLFYWITIAKISFRKKSKQDKKNNFVSLLCNRTPRCGVLLPIQQIMVLVAGTAAYCAITERYYQIKNCCKFTCMCYCINRDRIMYNVQDTKVLVSCQQIWFCCDPALMKNIYMVVPKHQTLYSQLGYIMELRCYGGVTERPD